MGFLHLLSSRLTLIESFILGQIGQNKAIRASRDKWPRKFTTGKTEYSLETKINMQI